MGELFFVCGSAAGAAFAWLFGRRERSRSTIVSFNGVLCALFGMVASTGHGATTPLTQTGCGFLGAATPLAWCATANLASGGLASAARRFCSTLALSLMCGIACAAMGFALAYGTRHTAHSEYAGESAHCSVPSPGRSGVVFPGLL